MKNTKPRLHPTTFRKMSPSLPDMPTAAAAIARFCGEIILPSTPPDELAAAMRTGLSPACLAAETCNAPKSELEDVSEPVTATPSQPRTGERTANAAPAPAIHLPSEAVWPEAFMTYARPRTAMTVTIANLSWIYVPTMALKALPTEIPMNGMVSRPDRTRRVPAAETKLNLNNGRVDALPDAPCRCRPGQANDVVEAARAVLTNGIWAMLNTAMMIRYGA